MPSRSAFMTAIRKRFLLSPSSPENKAWRKKSPRNRCPSALA
jgi:hypothetical protein